MLFGGFIFIYKCYIINSIVYKQFNMAKKKKKSNSKQRQKRKYVRKNKLHEMPLEKAYQFVKREDIDNELIIHSHAISQLPPDRIQITGAT